MEIKEYGKQGLIAWSNSKSHSELLASASLQEEQGLYNIDILSLDLQERSRKINVVGNGYTDSPFRCLAWDNFGEKEATYPHGLLFTGMENGSFKLWNPYDMIATYSSRQPPSPHNIDAQTCIIYEEEPEEDAFPVMCAEWNSLKNNFLAFGSTDVLIIDLSKDPSDPELVKPGKRNPHDGSYVTSVSWNREVAHILASASENGLVALWDIKTNNSIFQFKDSGASASGNRNVVICWSKNISTQIAVTLDDEKRNELQIWDLRNQKGPVVVIDRSHSRGINAMDWCETDPELILSSSRDGKVVCWNYTQEEEPISETTLALPAFNVKWSKKLPSIYSVSTDQKTAVYTLSDTNLFSYVPKWYKIPVASTFHGNDAVLTYSEQRGAVLHENRVAEGRKSGLKGQLKAIANLLEGKFDENENESEISGVLKAKAGGEHEIYDYLGFNKAKIVHEVEKFTGKKREFATGGSQKEKKSVKPKQKAYTQIQGQDALAFFAGIGSKNVEQSKAEEEDSNENVQYDMVPRNFNWDIGREGLVKQNILIGNYEGAIDAALKCGRTAEALIIAYSVDQNLFNNTLKTFFTETTDNFITDVLKHIAYKDALELVRKYDLTKWKECVALIHTLAPRDKRPALLRVLADRLRKETDLAALETSPSLLPENYAPAICYILAEDFAEIANIYWLNISRLRSGTMERKAAALEYGRRLLAIFEGVTVEVGDSRVFHKLVKEVAFIALEEGEKSLSHSLFVKYLPPNCQRHVDYLVHSCKELEQYRSSLHYKPIILPAMQPKKQPKQAAKPQEVPKRKNAKEEDKPAPPPAPKKRQEEEPHVGFSPYDNNPPPKQPTNAPKKNLNTPPPPPVAPKKAVQHVEEEPEREREREREPPVAKTNPPPPKKGPAPPPPPPPAHTHSSHSIPAEEETPVKPPPPKGPPKTQPPPPPAPEKKLPPPPAVAKQSPPPAKKEVQEQEEHYEPEVKQPPPPPKKKALPPPPVPAAKQPEPEYVAVREEPVRRQPPTREEVRPPPPPPAREEARQPPRAPLPPPPGTNVKAEQRRQEEEPAEEPVRRSLPPPPLPKRGPAPPLPADE